MTKRAEAGKQPKPPAFSGWISTDNQEIERRRWRGRTEVDKVTALEPELGEFGDFEVASASGSTYIVEIRDLAQLRNSCTCRDFDTAGLGTCKHVEGVLHHLRQGGIRSYRKAKSAGSQRIEIFLEDGSGGDLKVAVPAEFSRRDLAEKAECLAAALRGQPDRQAFSQLKELAGQHPGLIRVSRLLEGWMTRRLNDCSKEKRRASLLADVDAGRTELDLLNYPLYPYQYDGMLHLALARTGDAGRRNGPWQDGAGSCRHRTPVSGWWRRKGSCGVPRIIENGVGRTDFRSQRSGKPSWFSETSSAGRNNTPHRCSTRS